MKRDTTSQQYFEHKYSMDPDPWKFASSEYEQARYQVAFDSLNYRRFRRAFEPGCSIGLFTARLAAICDHVDAMDISPTAVARARERCKGLLNVSIDCGTFPSVMPSGEFDLIVLSEIGYYFDENQLHLVGQKVVERLLKGGDLLAVHWLGKSKDHLLRGDRVHEILAGLDGLVHVQGERHSEFRLDRWNRA